MRKPKLVGPQAIVGWRRDGRPIHMIGGGAPDNDDDTKDQGQKKDGDNKDDDGSLLEGDADNLDGDGDSDGDTDDSDGKAKTGGSVDKDTLVAEVTKSLETKIASMFDRRVNAVLKEIRKTGATGQDDKAGGKTGDTTQPDAGTSATDLRGARMAFREYISDEIRYISQEEKRFGTDLGQALLRVRAADGFDDEDRAGREVAQQVAQQVKALRKHYETRTLAALKKRGALVDKPGQTAAGPNSSVGAQSEYQKGAEIAKARFADRITAKT